MEPNTAAPDPSRCPVCGGPNGCAMACGDGAAPLVCWCVGTNVPPALLARVPPVARRKACICATCVAAADADARERRQ